MAFLNVFKKRGIRRTAAYQTVMEDLVELGVVDKEKYIALAGIPGSSLGKVLPTEAKPGAHIVTQGKCVFADSGRCQMHCAGCRAFRNDAILDENAELPEIDESLLARCVHLDDKSASCDKDCEDCKGFEVA
jgi:hypothetical protein